MQRDCPVGLLVIAKDDFTHARLCQQFKEHSVRTPAASLVRK